MALDTCYVISAQKVTKLPVSDVVIKRVEELAKNKVFKVLKFANRRGKPIFDASLIAGVDFDDNLAPPNAPDAEQEEEEQEEEQENEESEADSELEQKRMKKETIIGRKMKKIKKFKMNTIQRYIIKMATW